MRADTWGSRLMDSLAKQAQRPRAPVVSAGHGRASSADILWAPKKYRPPKKRKPKTKKRKPRRRARRRG